MSHSLSIPREIPVMTLPNTVLFPQAMLPLYIFEPRYRKMLEDVLNRHRLFAVAALHQDLAEAGAETPPEPGPPRDDYFEPSYDTASVGVIRACHANEDGTSNLILQGLCRVRFDHIVAETPYRIAAVTPLHSQTAEPPEDFARQRRQLLDLIVSLQDYDPAVKKEIITFLRKVEDPDAFIDLAAFSLIEDIPAKQHLLETLPLGPRYNFCEAFLTRSLRRLQMEARLRGKLRDEDILNN